MSDLCADPACAQIREWYLADEVKLAKIRAALARPATRYWVESDDLPGGSDWAVPVTELERILDGESRP